MTELERELLAGHAALAYRKGRFAFAWKRRKNREKLVGEPQAGASDVTPVSAPVREHEASSPTSTRGHWRCEGCGMPNVRSADACFGCGEWKATATLSRYDLLAEIQRTQLSERNIRDQHTKVWAAVTTGSGIRRAGEGWRDDEHREWEPRVGPMVECPVCAFSFGADHTSRGGGYSCPVCELDAQEPACPVQ